MKPRWRAVWFLLAALALVSSGCVWLRLLAFKNQLADLDRYTQVSTEHGWTVRFTKPVLYGDDLFLFLNSRPSSRLTNGNQQVWAWTFRKLYPATNTEAGNFDLGFEVLLEDERFSGFRFPERVAAILPQAMPLGFLRALGRANVNRKAHGPTPKSSEKERRPGELRFRWNATNALGEFKPMVRGQVAALMGKPFYASESNGLYSCLYKYQFEGTPPELLWARFTFAPNSSGAGVPPADKSETNEPLCSSEGALGNVGWTLEEVPSERVIQGKLFFAPPDQPPP